uniref:Uncharacterized protein n=1 Tax=Amphimedon queenslandica TaxID=400682 RepID=A0A1X7SDK4_AMPQE
MYIVYITVILSKDSLEALNVECAILSPTFKVRDFAIQDTQPYPIQLLWEINGEP